MSNIPKNIGVFKVYQVINGASKEFLGLATVTLPTLEKMSETWSPNGINGEIDMPSRTQYGPMGLSFEWVSVEPEAINLESSEVLELDLRAAVETQGQDGFLGTIPYKVYTKCLYKSGETGTFEKNKGIASSMEFEVLYYKREFNGKTLEIDKLNNIIKINGVDQNTEINKALGA